MIRYRYQATNANDETVSGEIDAQSVSEALNALEKQGLAIRSIEIVSPEKVASDAELALFYQELENLLERRSDWLPPLQSLAADLPRGSVRRQLERQVRAVSSIATAQEFIEHRDAIALLPFIVTRLHPDQGLRSRTDYLLQSSRQLEARSRYFNAFIYPSVLFGFSIIAFVLLSIFIFPAFSSLFQEIHTLAPKPTGLLLWSSELVNRDGIRAILCISLVGFVLFGLIRWWRSHAWTNRIFGRLVAGRTSNLLAMSTLTATLAGLLELKSPLGLALSIAGRHCKHAYYRQATECLAGVARSGVVAEIPLLSKKILPPLLLHALQPSESAQPHLPLLHELAALYGEQSRNRSDWIIAGGPNLAIFFVGVFIMWIVIELFSALAKIITSLSQ